MTVEVCEAPGVTPPRIAAPSGACDAHSHVFGPLRRFPPPQRSVYALPHAGPAVHAQVRARLGVRYGVLVQPGPYGDDPSAMLAAIAASGGTLKGVAVAQPSAPPATLASWASRGICALRFVEVRAPGGERYPGSVGFDALPSLAPAMRAAGLHGQLWGTPAQLIAALPDLLDLGLPLVIDHMGMVDVEQGLDGPETAALLELLAHPRVWVKLTVCRVARTPAALEKLAPVHRAMAETAVERALWGSDWPYVRLEPAPDAGALLDLFHAWTDDAGLRQAILVDNPARLFGFSGNGD